MLTRFYDFIYKSGIYFMLYDIIARINRRAATKMDDFMWNLTNGLVSVWRCE